MTIVSLPTQVLYLGAHEQEPVAMTCFKADGSVFDGTTYTPSFALRLEYDAADAFTASGVGVVDWISAPAGTVQFTPADGQYAGLVPGIYPGFVIATAATRTKRFYTGRFELRKAY